MDSPDKFEVPADQLRWRCDPAELGFKSTKEVKCCDEIIGQERAIRSIHLGLDIKSPGYNIFVAGLTGTGKTTTIKRLLESIDTENGAPQDLCYVHNFTHPDQPRALMLPNGKGVEFSADMDDLVQELLSKLPKMFESEEFQLRSKKAIEERKAASVMLFKRLEEQIRKGGFAVVTVEMGTVSHPEILPVIDDKVVSWEQLGGRVGEGKFSESAFVRLQKKHDKLAEELEKSLRENRLIEKSIHKALDDLKFKVTLPVVRELITEMKDKYSFEVVHDYLDAAQNHILQNLERFKEPDETGMHPALPQLNFTPKEDFLELKVNVVVDNATLDRAPVVIETAPSYRNLFGTIERVMDSNGIWHSDFTRIKSGSLLKANGGYLVINLLDALTEAGVWAALKRTLKNRQLDIQVYDPFYLAATSALKPEAVELDVKVVIIGETSLYQLLYFYDEDFKKIFKVKADFDSEMSRDKNALKKYAEFVRKICDEENLMPFSAAGVAEVIEHGIRLAGRQHKISTRFSDIADVMREAHYWARVAKGKQVTAEHVQRALLERISRVSMVEDKIQEMIQDGTLMIEIKGRKTGQVNGLSVYDLGEYRFGRPTKITAEVSIGRAGIINIEREADLSGKTHDKGVLIIGGYLRGKYAQAEPLTMTASVAFEQSYSGVDGDSASSTEVYAILSSLADVPLRQDIAVTGSINQKGDIQPIGGVNEKIEGFYAVCKAKGLSGKQGVMIPYLNKADLMLKPEVVQAVAKGKFHIYAIETIESGIEILTGFAAGRKDDNGEYPPESVNARVQRRLQGLAAAMRAHSASDDDRRPSHENSDDH